MKTMILGRHYREWARGALLGASLLLGLSACDRPGEAGALSSTMPPTMPPKEEAVTFVRDGKAQAVLIYPAKGGEEIARMLADFAALVERSTGVKLPVVPEGEETAIAGVRLYAGPTQRAEALGLSAKDLERESYRIAKREHEIVLLGADEKEPDERFGDGVAKPTRWALNRWLEDGLGIRWLWPGELGTYVPKATAFKAEVRDETYQPKLEIRVLRMNNTKKRSLASLDRELDGRLRLEAKEWAENHQAGRREAFKIGHAFGHWWGKYSKDHPDYFAELVPEYRDKAPFPNAQRAKLRLANPAVMDAIVQEYKEAGAPDYWNVCPNDGGGFDVSEATRAWDLPLNQDPFSIFSSRGNLTGRYVKFWNLLHDRLREVNPRVRLVTYAYSCYRFPPTEERPLTARAVIGVVPSDEDYEVWDGWSKGDVGLLLRPNWWHLGGDAPYLRLRKMTAYMKHTWAHGMIGLDMDSILGYWSTQGANYYFAARLMTHPELTYEQLLEEYTSAFGGGKAKVREYLVYWEKLADAYAYHRAGLIRSGLPAEGGYVDLIRQGKVNEHVLAGSKYVLPYLYGEEVLAPARKLLAEARSATLPEEEEARARIRFLERGLESLEQTRTQVELGRELRSRSSRDALREFTEHAKKLERYRENESHDHAIWGQTMRWHEDRYNVLVRPENMKAHNLFLDDL